jgi:RNA polymerase sigma-70 factor (ECF subfamily)
LESFLAAQIDSPSGFAIRREREIQLADALAALPADYRDIIVLRHIKGMSFDEIAQNMERSAGALRMLWLRALKKLRISLETIETK